MATARSTGENGVIMRAEAYSGPVVHHSIAEGWEAVVPGSASRILSMAEGQSKHRQFIEKWSVIARSISQPLGSMLGAGLGAYALYLGADLIRDGKDVQGFGVLLSGIVPLVWAFRRATKTQPGRPQR